MAYIFMDESGDLGFNEQKEKTSKNFIIAFLFSQNKNILDKIVKKVFNALPQNIKKKHSGTFHCYKEQPKVRLKLLSLLKDKKDISIMIIRLNKGNVWTDLRQEKSILYNYVVNILLNRVFSKKLIPIKDKIVFIQSQRETNKLLNLNFKQYISQQVKKNHGVELVVEIKRPSEEKALQIVDFVSWGVFRKYEHNDDTYYNIIKDLIRENTSLYE
ncbi:MAG: DUF3800 domain-containing protein [Elusimicrobia bacterium]|nr:DUF3800 domain-containing protein [Elusimicrobiota bacterium]